MIKCMALDMDDTVLDSTHFSEENKAAILAAIEEGVHVVIASGRSFHTLPEEVTSLPGIEYAITSNGASVYRVSTGERIHSSLLEPQAVEKILELTKGEPLYYEAFVDGLAYSDTEYLKDPLQFGGPKEAVEFFDLTRTPVDDMPGFIRAHETELESIAMMMGDPELKKRLWETLEKEIPDVYITSSFFHLLEFSNKGTGKGAGLKYIMDLLGLKREEVAAFGNEDNDCDMLSYAGVGIAVANASPKCLATADRIVASCKENGAAQGIYELLKENEEEAKENG